MTDLRAVLEVVIPLVKRRYSGVDDDRLREIFKDVMADAVGDADVTPASIIATMDKRVNAELRQ